MTVQLDSPLTALAGVGPALAKKLERLNLYRVEDLLFLLPLRYEDRTQLVRLGALVAGERCRQRAAARCTAASALMLSSE